MFKLEFSIVHRGCLVNELSRELPQVRFVCPGGFILGPDSAEEVLALDDPTDSDVDSVMGLLRRSEDIAEVELLERTADRAFVRILTSSSPETGYVSQAVERNRCFRIGTEVQEGGVEQWVVGCLRRSQAEALVEELGSMGELKYHRLSEASWAALA